MAAERILVTVKTYPTLSRSYGELVCTAGVREDGSWVRLYPIPFRRLDDYSKFSKWEWLEMAIVDNPRDPRPETRRPVDPNAIVRIGKLDTKNGWQARKDIVLRRGEVFDQLTPLIQDAHENKRSLATFKPKEIIDLIVEETDRRWDAVKVDQMRIRNLQGSLFDESENWRESLRIIRKVPYRFKYHFRTADGKESKMTILDWEIGELYWNALEYSDGDERTAVAKVRHKLVDEFRVLDLHFFLGTTEEHHNKKAPNPWTIIGLFYPPVDLQMELF